MKYLIIGNSAAATGAIEGIRSRDSEGEITVVGAEQRPAYGRPLISYYLAGQVDENHMYFRGPDFYRENRVVAVLGAAVEKINVNNKQVVLEDSGELLDYDRLLISSGGAPVQPSCFAGSYNNLFTFYTWDDIEAIDAYLAGMPKEAHVLIIGAGLIGLKAAEALVKRGYTVSVAEAAPRILPSILNQEASAKVQAYLEEKGITFYLGNPVERLLGRDAVEKAVLQDMTEVECGLMISAVGVVPNMNLIAGANIAAGRGITVNARMETSAKHVFAAGDAAEAYDEFAGLHRVVPIWPFAYRQGRVAGVNMAGGTAEWKGGPVFNSLPLLGLNIATGGQSTLNNGEGCRILKVSQPNYRERQVMIDGNQMVGFTMLGDIGAAGVYRYLVENRLDVSSFEDRLIAFDFGIIDLPGVLTGVNRGGGF